MSEIRDNEFLAPASGISFGGPCPTCGQSITPPNDYTLLHHAAQLARQLEAAQMPEAWWGVDFTESSPAKWAASFTFKAATITIWPNGDCEAEWPSNDDLSDLMATFRVGDPLPPALIATLRRPPNVPRYNAYERAWVRRLLATLTPEERAEYEIRMRAAPPHVRTGKKYDGLKAEVAERVKYEFRRRA